MLMPGQETARRHYVRSKIGCADKIMFVSKGGNELC
jgi:hypothetical protein